MPCLVDVGPATLTRGDVHGIQGKKPRLSGLDYGMEFLSFWELGPTKVILKATEKYPAGNPLEGLGIALEWSWTPFLDAMGSSGNLGDRPAKQTYTFYYLWLMIRSRIDRIDTIHTFLCL